MLRSLALARRARWSAAALSRLGGGWRAPATLSTASPYRWKSTDRQGPKGRHGGRKDGARGKWQQHLEPVGAPTRKITAEGAISVGDSTGFSMGLQFLGTASTFPTSARSTSSLAVSFRCGSVWLFDCGENTQLQLRKSSVRMGRIKKIFITHVHGDHTFGLPGVLLSLSTPKDDDGGDADEPIQIIAPEGTAQYLRSTLRFCRAKIVRPYFVTELRMPAGGTGSAVARAAKRERAKAVRNANGRGEVLSANAEEILAPGRLGSTSESQEDYFSSAASEDFGFDDGARLYGQELPGSLLLPDENGHWDVSGAIDFCSYKYDATAAIRAVRDAKGSRKRSNGAGRNGDGKNKKSASTMNEDGGSSADRLVGSSRQDYIGSAARDAAASVASAALEGAPGPAARYWATSYAPDAPPSSKSKAAAGGEKDGGGGGKPTNGLGDFTRTSRFLASDDVVVKAGRVKHGSIPCFGFSLEEPEEKGRWVLPSLPAFLPSTCACSAHSSNFRLTKPLDYSTTRPLDHEKTNSERTPTNQRKH